MKLPTVPFCSSCAAVLLLLPAGALAAGAPTFDQAIDRLVGQGYPQQVESYLNGLSVQVLDAPHHLLMRVGAAIERVEPAQAAEERLLDRHELDVVGRPVLREDAAFAQLELVGGVAERGDGAREACHARLVGAGPGKLPGIDGLSQVVGATVE